METDTLVKVTGSRSRCSMTIPRRCQVFQAFGQSLPQLVHMDWNHPRCLSEAGHPHALLQQTYEGTAGLSAIDRIDQALNDVVRLPTIS